MKFCLVVPEEFKTHWQSHPFEISGLLQWQRALDGDIRTINEDLTPYDTIMTNVSSTESEYISLIRQENPSCKIVACFDYGFGVVNQYFTTLERVKQVMSRADVLFSVNQNQRDWMKVLLPDRDIHYIPHPTDIDNMLRFRRPREARVPDSVAYMVHQYDIQQVQGLEVLKAVERKLKRKLRKSIVGVKSRVWKNHGHCHPQDLPQCPYGKPPVMMPAYSWPIVPPDYPDEKLRGTPLDPELPGLIEHVPQGVGWDIVIPYFGVEQWYSFLSENYVALDLYTVDSIGRFGMDCAGVGVPLVASDKQDSSKLLYPLTHVDPFDPEAAVNFVAKLFKDENFYTRVENIAMKNLQNYSFAKSKERMMRALES